MLTIFLITVFSVAGLLISFSHILYRHEEMGLIRGWEVALAYIVVFLIAFVYAGVSILAMHDFSWLLQKQTYSAIMVGIVLLTFGLLLAVCLIIGAKSYDEESLTFVEATLVIILIVASYFLLVGGATTQVDRVNELEKQIEELTAEE